MDKGQKERVNAIAEQKNSKRGKKIKSKLERKMKKEGKMKGIGSEKG
jgi:hypothetical protein